MSPTTDKKPYLCRHEQRFVLHIAAMLRVWHDAMFIDIMRYLHALETPKLPVSKGICCCLDLAWFRLFQQLCGFGLQRTTLLRVSQHTFGSLRLCDCRRLHDVWRLSGFPQPLQNAPTPAFGDTLFNCHALVCPQPKPIGFDGHANLYRGGFVSFIGVFGSFYQETYSNVARQCGRLGVF